MAETGERGWWWSDGVEVAVTEVGKLPHHFIRARMRERQTETARKKDKGYMLEEENCETEFKDCAAKAIFKVETLVTPS